MFYVSCFMYIYVDSKQVYVREVNVLWVHCWLPNPPCVPSPRPSPSMEYTKKSGLCSTAKMVLDSSCVLTSHKGLSETCCGLCITLAFLVKKKRALILTTLSQYSRAAVPLLETHPVRPGLYSHMLLGGFAQFRSKPLNSRLIGHDLPPGSPHRSAPTPCSGPGRERECLPRMERGDQQRTQHVRWHHGVHYP